jgi:hypothetical protein
MERRLRTILIAVAVGALVAATTAGGAQAGDGSGGGRGTIDEKLTGFQEDPAVVSTPGGGELRLRVDQRAQTITYRLSYADLAGAVSQAHIHFGGRHQSGGISVWLCGNVATTPAGVQACPPAPATITGELTAADVVGPAAQGIAAGEFAELVDAIRNGVTYANVHSAAYPGGEIRGQINDDHHH